jgi:hypothetical protein
MKNQFSAEQITEVMEKRGVSRAMAGQWLRRQAKKAAAPAPVELKVTKGDAADLNRVFGTKATKKSTKAPHKAKATKAPNSAAYPDVHFNVERIVRLYTKEGKNVSQIAQAIGYPFGHGNNRTKAALVAAGVWKPATK